MWILILFNLAFSYNSGDDVILWFNKILPFHNPQESYSYSKLPLCRGSGKKHSYVLGLGEAVEGYELQDSGMEIQFLQNVRYKAFCKATISHEDVSVLVNALERNFWVQMYIDDLPIWSPLGSYDARAASVFTHYNILIRYNSSDIVQTNLEADKPVKVYDAREKKKSADALEFTYSVTWMPSDVTYEERFNSYLDPGFFENNIHWFSILNSFVMALLLCAFVIGILLRTLKRDYAKYETQELEPLDIIDSVGWKQVSGDVFRPPQFLIVFTSLLSQGWQLNFVALIGLLISLMHPMYGERGSFASIAIISYSILGGLGGFIASYFYRLNRGNSVKGCIFLGSAFYPIFVISICLGLNMLAIVYSSSATIPVSTMIKIGVLLAFIYCPLYLLGSYVGRSMCEKHGKFPKVNSISTPILKEKHWKNDPLLLILAGGLLPFGSISVEIYFVFTSFWNYKFYYVYGFALVGFLVLAVSLVCVSIVVAYIVLNSEDYRWHWVSFLSSGSIGLYLYAYSIYYYVFKTKMTGYFQLNFYFGYTGLASVSIFLMAGAIGYTGAYLFVKTIYRNVKVE